MHIILGLVGLATAAYFFMIRARNAAEISSELVDLAQNVRAAARRFGFRRRTNVHPVDAIEEHTLAIGGLATAFLELDDLPTADARTALDLSLRKHLNLDAESAKEILVLGHWFVENCGRATPAIPRLSKKLYALNVGDSFGTLMAIIQDISQSAASGLSTRQSEALQDIQRAFRLK